ncbi:MAG TPA: phospholipase D-like domain-containing protein [Candidatus Saccharimonadales bacterium]|jgi:phosphatidylserine/phosphatidylglycerophosphate/cardiolipin synthase-like enzyme
MSQIRLLTCLALISATLCVIYSNPVNAYAPPAGPIFNNPSNHPNGPSATIIQDRIETMIDHAPKGSTIRIVTLRFDLKSTLNALRRAHNRGVIVRFVIPDVHAKDPYVVGLARNLNKRSFKGDTSYVAYCHLACYADAPSSVLHPKIYMFSQTGTARHVVMTSSANLTHNMVSRAYNDAYTAVGDAAIYTNMRRYFDGMRDDKTPRANPHRTFSMQSGRLVYEYFPDTQSPLGKDSYSRIFDSITCTGAAKTGGDGNGHTVVSVVTPLWAGSRTDLARRLVYLHRRGCVVNVLVATAGTDAVVMKTLLDGGVTVRDSAKFNRAGKRILYAHSKYIAISGVYGANRTANTVFTGSANMSRVGVTASDNVLVRIKNSPATYRDYKRNFNYIWRDSTPVTAATALRAPVIDDTTERQLDDE